MKMQSGKREVDKMFKRRNRYEIPDWQRQKIWSRPKKQKLIDSMLRGWKLPKFYFYKLEEDQFEVVDGQQRLTAIFEFCSDEWPLNDDSAEEFGGSLYSDLPINVQETFDDFEIEYDEIADANEQELKEFFLRLQAGLPTTASEKLNASHSKLRDYCKKLSEHEFFKSKVAVANTRYAHFDIVSKVASLELDGLLTGLRYEDLKKVFDSNASFSSGSAAGKKLKKTFDYLNKVFPQKSSLLRNRTIVQSFATLVARLVDTGKADGHESEVLAFFDQFMRGLAMQVELGQDATDADYVVFQKSVNANVRTGPRTRQEILLRKLLTVSPKLADLFDPSIVAESGLRSRIAELGESICNLVTTANATYSSKHGKDIFKPTTKTVQAQTRLGKMVKDLTGYKTLVDDLYFLFHEGPGNRLDGIADLASFGDVNDRRTEQRHDVDHGKSGKVQSKRKKLGNAFHKYSGSYSPTTLAPERFAAVQAKLLSEIEKDLYKVIAAIT